MTNMSGYLKNILTLTSGTVAAQLFAVVCTPFLSRLYTPEDFGAFAFYGSLVGAFGLVATLRYEMGIILPESEKDRFGMFTLSMAINALLCLGLLILIIALQTAAPGWIPVGPRLRSWLYALPLLVFLIGAGNVFQHWFTRVKEYGIIAAGKVLNAAGSNVLMLVLGLCGAGAWGLVGGYAIGLLAFSGFFLYHFICRSNQYRGLLDRHSLIPLARQYCELPLANMPQVITEMVQVNGLIYLLQAFFTTTIVGWHAFAMRILQAPLWLLGTSITQVFYRDASEKFNKDGDISAIVHKTVKLAALVAVPAAAVLFASAPAGFAFVFGEPWREAGVFARILAPWLCADFIRYTVAQTPLIVRRTRRMFVLSLIGSVLTVTAIVTGGLTGCSARATLALQSSIMTLHAGAVIAWILMITRKKKE